MERTGGKPTKLDDSSLVELALQRDQGAFALLLEKYRSSLMSHILKYVSVVEDAEDICQRSFEKAFMNIDRYNAQYAFSTCNVRRHFFDFFHDTLRQGQTFGNGGIHLPVAGDDFLSHYCKCLVVFLKLQI